MDLETKLKILKERGEFYKKLDGSYLLKAKAYWERLEEEKNKLKRAWYTFQARINQRKAWKYNQKSFNYIIEYLDLRREIKNGIVEQAEHLGYKLKFERV